MTREINSLRIFSSKEYRNKGMSSLTTAAHKKFPDSQIP